jgi:hypothetical protein
LTENISEQSQKTEQYPIASNARTGIVRGDLSQSSQLIRMHTMSEHIQRTIADLQQHLTELEAEGIDLKKTINSLCRRIHQAPIYPDAELERSHSIVGPMRGDEYYGKALASVVRWVLEARKAANLGPATVNEIYDAMASGGYQFEAKNEDNAKRGLRISLTKNGVFHRLPTGKFGLTEWYPAIKDKAERKRSAEGEEGEEDELPETDAPIVTESGVTIEDSGMLLLGNTPVRARTPK